MKIEQHHGAMLTTRIYGEQVKFSSHTTVINGVAHRRVWVVTYFVGRKRFEVEDGPSLRSVLAHAVADLAFANRAVPVPF